MVTGMCSYSLKRPNCLKNAKVYSHLCHQEIALSRLQPLRQYGYRSRSGLLYCHIDLFWTFDTSACSGSKRKNGKKNQMVRVEILEKYMCVLGCQRGGRIYRDCSIGAGLGRSRSYCYAAL